ncbi:NAD(P)/FAD-dependent oxidoreductase [Wenzhouxiangella limi]|uniref:FAD-dependent oxidoreductase n=1 Tax=Wenzhouxiangella limi TaxID=2707351 RepID=A0A845V3Q9_9GAMM|nr:FAD-dependent oxidoreductase [Wenzhouxiangella limi]NDY94871.1 FAD-dependent oxidoreductase [Wenzhouxiangella limi]
MPHDVCVIGAGWSGLAAATELQRAGLDVVVVEKARGPGGRCATRRQDGFAFDHGGQYFTARSSAFAAAVEDWKRQGLVAAWAPEIHVFGRRPKLGQSSPAERLVALPGMNGVLKHLAGSLDCRFGWRAERLVHDGSEWNIHGASGAEPVKAAQLLLTAPPQQSADLLRGVSGLAERIAAVPMSPCWALMLGFEQPLEAGFDAAFDNDGPLSWLARNSSKPARDGEAWIAHASAQWSADHLEAPAEEVARALLAAFRSRVPAVAEVPPALLSAHRWRYALAPEPLNEACLVNQSRALVVAGDWCAGNRIEGAWTSGRAAAEVLSQWRD